MTERANKFGFEVAGGRRIDLDQADTVLAGELMEAVEAWRSCISCGACAATCPAGQNSGFNFRRLHYDIRMGVMLTAFEKLSALSPCLLCGKCQLICPRGIPTRYLAILIMQKNRSHAEGIPSL